MARKSSGDSKSAWFRKFFRENRHYLGPGTNDAVLELWRKDHPGREPDASIRNVLANVKSSVKKEKGRKGRPKKQAAQAGNGANAVRTPARASSPKQLEELELAIDGVLMMAARLENPTLEEAVKHLRRARTLIVWQQGERS